MMQKLDLEGADMYLLNYPGPSEYVALRDSVTWEQKILNMYGKKISQPRMTAWYGDPGCSYSYSGIKNEPLPWCESVRQVKSKIEVLLNYSFNSALLNYYRNGNDSVGYHSDNEKELGEEPVIASVSFGAARPFYLRSKATNEKYDILLEDCSILLMMGETQKNWVHAIPKIKEEDGRINLTFRNIII